MTRVPAALCALIGCAMGGRALAAQYRERARLAEKWERSLLRLLALAEAGGLPLPRLMAAVEDDPVLAAGAKMLEEAPGMPPAQWWARLPVEKGLSPEARETLREALLALFAYPARQQTRALERAVEKMAALRAREKESNAVRAALAGRLGLLLGAAVFILLC